jgi:heavy metal sensor kinase
MSFSLGNRIRHTLALRLALWYAALFLAGSVFVISLTYVLLSASLEQRDHEIIRSTLEEYATEYRRGGLQALERRIASERAGGGRERLFVRVLGRRDEALLVTMPAEWSEFNLAELDRQIVEGDGWTLLRGPRDDVALEVASARLADGTLFQVGKSTETRTELISRFRALLTAVLISVIVIAVTGGAILTYSGLQPVRELIGVVRTTMQTGRTDARVPVRQTNDALDELSVLFNAMLDRIERLMSAMRGALDNVAHDLRTPMTRLRATAETALQRLPADPQAYREALADCLEESDRVLTMLNTLMDISEAETGAMKLQLEPLDIAAVVNDAVELYGDVAEEKGVAVDVRFAGPVGVTGDRNRLRQVFANLLDNAVKYSPSGGHVTVEGRRSDNVVVVSVKDTGIGMAAHELPRIWERLYRGDQSRSERGLGLGLSLVRAIVEAHGGTTEVESEPGRGSTFTVRLPTSNLSRM